MQHSIWHASLVDYTRLRSEPATALSFHPFSESEASMTFRVHPAAFLVLMLFSGAGPLLAQMAADSRPVNHWALDQESGIVFSGYNDVRIPGDTGTKFSLTDDLDTDSKIYYRLQLSYTFSGRHTVSGTYAPLTLGASGSFDSPVDYRGVTFPADSLVNATYQFANYRLTYRYEFLNSGKWEAGLGLTGFIRDAAIRLRSTGLSAEKTDLGFVPLLHFRARRIFSPKTSLLLEGDALIASQGRAEDVLLAFQYWPVNNFRLKLGYRVLEGGADNDEVYNFSLLHYAVVGAILEF